MNHLPHLASRLYGTPLLIARSKLDVILSVLGDRIHWPDQRTEDRTQRTAIIAAPFLPNSAGNRQSSVIRPQSSETGIALIPVVGTLVRRTVGLEAESGLLSYGEIAAMLEAALADPSIEGILLEVDSPGGEAGGVFELAERIRAMDAVKPIWAIASDSAFSAAYAIACSGSNLTVTRTGGVGSVGVIAMHVDQSVRDAQQGYRYTAITAGTQKNDFSPHEPLDPGASARLQTEVDRLYGMFVDHVATMRQIKPDIVRGTEAGVYFGDDAVAGGLADRVGSLDDVLTEFSHFLVARRSPVVSTAARTLFVSTQKEFPTMQTDATPHTTEPVSAEPSVEHAAEPTTEPAVAPELPAPVPQTAQSASPTVPPPIPDISTTVRAEALAIAELCQLAGVPNRTAEFLAQGVSSEQVRKTLLAARADRVDITSTLNPDAAASTPSASSPTASNPLVAAVKKLTGKE